MSIGRRGAGPLGIMPACPLVEEKTGEKKKAVMLTCLEGLHG